MNAKLTQTTLKNVVMLSRNIERTSNFFSEVIGLKLIHQTEKLAELKDAKEFRLLIKHSPK